MIWIDASFAIEWLLGTPRAEKIPLGAGALSILSAQYAEILVFFTKRGVDFKAIVEQLKTIVLAEPTRQELQAAAALYVKARKTTSKASLADAVLAAVAKTRNGTIASFDQDFETLGCRLQTNGLYQSK